MLLPSVPSSLVQVRHIPLAASRGNAAWVTFATGLRRNSMTLQVLEELTDTMTRLDAEPDVGLVVLTSAEADFSAGADPDVLAMTADARRYVATEYELFERIEDAGAVTVAAVDGYCLGNAAEMSLACDFRVVGPRLRWGFPEARLGLMAPVSRLLRQVPRGVATRLALGGRWLDTAEAAAAGVAEATTPDVTSDVAVLAAVDHLTAATPAGARWTKQAIRDARDGRHREPELALESLKEAARRDHGRHG